MRLIEETVLPNDLRNFLAVRAAVNGYGRFVAAAGIFRIALQVDVLLVGQSSAGGVDGKPFGAAGNREANLGVGAAIVDGCLQFGRAERNSDHVGSKDARLGKARHSLDLDAVIEGLLVGAHGFVLRGKAQLNIVGGPRAGDAALIGHAVDAAGHDLAVHGVPEDPTVTVIANIDVVKCETAGAGAAFAGVAVEVQVEETAIHGIVGVVVESEKVGAGTRSELEGDLGQLAGLVLRANLHQRSKDHIVGFIRLAANLGQF